MQVDRFAYEVSVVAAVVVVAVVKAPSSIMEFFNGMDLQKPYSTSLLSLLLSNPLASLTDQLIVLVSLANASGRLIELRTSVCKNNVQLFDLSAMMIAPD